MSDISREIYLREDQPDLCADWRAPQWALYHQKLDQISNGGMITGTAMRFVAKAVNQELPAVTHLSEQERAPRKVARSSRGSKKGAKKMHELPQAPSLEASLHSSLSAPPLPSGPVMDQYLTEIRRKFEALIMSKHRQSVSAFVEDLYRDIVFLEDHAEGG